MKLQANFVAHRIRRQLPFYPGYGPEGDDLDIFGGKIICTLMFKDDGHVLLNEIRVVDFSASTWCRMANTDY